MESKRCLNVRDIKKFLLSSLSRLEDSWDSAGTVKINLLSRQEASNIKGFRLPGTVGTVNFIKSNRMVV